MFGYMVGFMEREVSKMGKAINIRLLETDIQKIKAMALNEGMPYQTYITHLIHKFATSGL